MARTLWFVKLKTNKTCFLNRNTQRKLRDTARHTEWEFLKRRRSSSCSYECSRSIRAFRRPRRHQKVIPFHTLSLSKKKTLPLSLSLSLTLTSFLFKNHRVSYERDTKIINAASFTIEREDHTVGNILRMYANFN